MAGSTIATGAGNDTIYTDIEEGIAILLTSSGSSSVYINTADVINAGDGNDSIVNHYIGGIYGGNGDDSIYSDTATWCIDGEGGNDSIRNTSRASRIYGGDGNDYIGNSGENSRIYGGDGKDSIYNLSRNVSIDGGDGDDSIQSYGDYAHIDGGDGDDSIRSYGDNAVIIGGNGNDSIHNSARDASTYGGHGSYASIDGGDGDDYIYNDNYAADSSIYGGDGKDSIYNLSRNVSIDGGDGDDSIQSYGDYAVIIGGNGNDYIYNQGINTEINAGSGIDTIVGQDSLSENFIHSAGTDIIYGFGSNDMLFIESGQVTSSVVSGSDVILTTSNNGSIILKNTKLEDIVAHSDHWFGYEPYEGSDAVSGSSVSGSSVSGSNSTGSSTTSATGSYDSVSNSMISINSATKSATMVMNETDQAYNLTFYNNGTAEKWNATLSGGNDTITIGDIKGGRFDGGDGRDSFYISSSLQGDITLTGGATNDNLESGNNFYAESSSVSIASKQNKITITDVNFNASDVVLIDAGVENLTADFFGNSRFYNYANASDASSSGIYAGTVFNASALVSRLGMSFSMLRMADKSRVTLDNNNSIDENYITNVVWANSYSATIDFSSTQTDEVLIFTNTNSRGDIVSLGGNFNDTIHAGRYDTIDAGGGNDQIYIDDSSAVTIGYSEGDGNDIVYNFTDDDVFSITSDSSYSSMQSGNNMILTIGGNNVTLVGSSDSQTFNIQTTSRYYDVASDSLWGNSDSRESDLLSLTSSDLPENFVTVDEISTQFTDTGLVLTINDSNLNIIGTNLTTFSLAGGRYPADFSNRTFTS